MGLQKTIAGALVAAAMTIAPFAAHAENKPVDITFGGKSTAQVMHKGKLVTIQRVQDNGNNVTHLLRRRHVLSAILYSADQLSARCRDNRRK